MNKFLTLCLLAPLLTFGQIHITDSFADGDFTVNPNWSGNNGVFEVSDQQLRLSDSAAGSAFLSLNSNISVDAVWEFYVKLDFNPSGSNYCKIYLSSNDTNLQEPLQGYYLRIGGSSQDRISLMRQDGVSSTVIAESAEDYVDVNPFEIRVKVIRDSTDNWQLWSDTGAAVDPVQLIASTVDSIYRGSSAFGIVCHYTSTRSDRFYFDDFNLTGSPYVDQIAPILDSLNVSRINELELFFSEALERNSAEDISNYQVSSGVGTAVTADLDSVTNQKLILRFVNKFQNGSSYFIHGSNITDLSGNPGTISANFVVEDSPAKIAEVWVEKDSIIKIRFNEEMDLITTNDISNYQLRGSMGFPLDAVVDSNVLTEVSLYFASYLPQREVLTFTVNGVEDEFGNILNDTVNFAHLYPQYGDVLINELMPDPSPVAGIPPNALSEREYVEIYNLTQLPLNLKNWKIEIGKSSSRFPALILPADSFVVITSEEAAAEFPAEINVVGLDISSTALLNAGTTINLLSAEGELINTVSYSNEWYSDDNKDDGGWSLELIDTANSCGGEGNWRASENLIGGTPGRKNSVMAERPDSIPPQFGPVAIISDSSIVVHFSETVDHFLLADTSNYKIQPKLKIHSAEPTFPHYTSVTIAFSYSIDPHVIYTLGLKNFPIDCNGNQMLKDSIRFTVPSVPQPNEILINEILFDPLSGGSDFIELYNNSDKIFDLQNLRLAKWDVIAQTPADPVQIRESSFLFEPGEYLAITTDADFLEDNYFVKFPDRIIEVKELPSMADDEGRIALATSNLKPIDHFSYLDDFHLGFMDEVEGVSLERISSDRNTNDENNWTSASAAAGYATPGYVNSQNIIPNLELKVTVEPKVFRPVEETVALGYNFKNTGHVLSVSIWDAAGRKLCDIVRNENVSQQGFVVWDGTNGAGELQNSGIYIVVFDYFSTEGKREVLKEVCVLSR